MNRYCIWAGLWSLLVSGVAYAGISEYVTSAPPIKAKIAMDRRFTTPGGVVHLWASDGFGGAATDLDTRYVNGAFAGVVEDSISVIEWEWTDSGGNKVITQAPEVDWTAPLTEGASVIKMRVFDAGHGGATAIDSFPGGSPVYEQSVTILVSNVGSARQLSASPASGASVMVEWYQPQGIQLPVAFNIYRYQVGGAAVLAHTETAQSGPLCVYTWTDTGLATGTTYFYYIRSVVTLSPLKEKLQSADVAATPQASSPARTYYVANSLSNHVSVIDADTRKIYSTIPIGPTYASSGSVGPLGAVVAPDGSRVYVSNYGPDPPDNGNLAASQSSVSVIDPALLCEEDTDTSRAAWPTSTAPGAMTRLTFQQSGEGSRAFRLNSMAGSLDGRYVFVANYGGRRSPNGADYPGSIERIERLMPVPPTGPKYAVTRLLDGLAHLTKLVPSADATTLFAVSSDGYIGSSGEVLANGDSVSVISLSEGTEGTILDELPLRSVSGRRTRPQGAAQVSFTDASSGQTHSLVYVANGLDESVHVINATGRATVLTDTANGGAPIPLPRLHPAVMTYPVDVAGSSDGKFVFVVGTEGYDPSLGSSTQFRSVIWVLRASLSPSAADVVAGPIPLVGYSAQAAYGAGQVQVLPEPLAGGTGYCACVTHYSSGVVSWIVFNPDGSLCTSAPQIGISTGRSGDSTTLYSAGPGGVALRTSGRSCAPGPDIQAEILMDNLNPEPGSDVFFEVTDGQGGDPFDYDVLTQDGQSNLVADRLASVRWTLTGPSGASEVVLSTASAFRFQQMWSLPASASSGAYTVKMEAFDRGAYGTGSADSAGTSIHTRTATFYVGDLAYAATPAISADISLGSPALSLGGTTTLTALAVDMDSQYVGSSKVGEVADTIGSINWRVVDKLGKEAGTLSSSDQASTQWTAPSAAGNYYVSLSIGDDGSRGEESKDAPVAVMRTIAVGGGAAGPTRTDAAARAYAFYQAVDPARAAAQSPSPAVFPAGWDSPTLFPPYWLPRWQVKYADDAEIEVIDASGAIARYLNIAEAAQLMRNAVPAAAGVGAAAAMSTANAALVASGTPMGELAAGVVTECQDDSPSTGGGHSWEIVWRRQFSDGVYPTVMYRDDCASASVTQTGVLTSFALSFSSPPPVTSSYLVNQDHAEDTALDQLVDAEIDSPEWLSSAELVVQPNSFWSDGSMDPQPGLSRVAWVCRYTAGALRYEVWVDRETGAVIGGTEEADRGKRSQTAPKPKLGASSIGVSPKPHLNSALRVGPSPRGRGQSDVHNARSRRGPAADVHPVQRTSSPTSARRLRMSQRKHEAPGSKPHGRAGTR